MSEKSAEAELFEQVDSIDDSALLQVSENDKKARIGDPGWTEYVLSFLTEKETVPVKNKSGLRLPKTDALRRVCTKIFGKVIKSKSHPEHIIMTDEGMIAVVSHELIIERDGGEGLLEVWGLADAREQHLIAPFNQYVPANASTKAMGRAYRDALQLQVLVAEELNNMNDFTGSFDDIEDAVPLDRQQKSAILKLCNTLKIDPDKFIKQGLFPHNDIDDVLKGTARKMISVLNGYQSGTEIPAKILLSKDE